MSGYFGITDAIRKAFSGTDRVNTITHGNLDLVDLSRQTIYPLVHVVSNGVTFGDKTTDYAFGITIMDIVDFDRSDPADESEPFYGDDNAQDILHDLGITMELAISELRRGDLYDDLFRINGDVTGVAFINEGENVLAGYNVTISATGINASINDGIC